MSKNMQIQELIDMIKNDKSYNDTFSDDNDLIYKLLHNHYQELDFNTFYKLKKLSLIQEQNEILKSIEDKLYN